MKAGLLVSIPGIDEMESGAVADFNGAENRSGCYCVEIIEMGLGGLPTEMEVDYA